MARRLILSTAAFIVAFCLGLSLITTAGAALVAAERFAAPAEVVPAP